MKKKKVLVVGGGLGGLSAAISLAADGFEVDLFEKNDHLGGKLNRLQKEGFSFDLGPSILTLPEVFEDLFSRHGQKMGDYLRLQSVDPHWRNFFDDGTVVDFCADPGQTGARNPALSSGDVADLRRFLDYSRKLYENSRPGYFDAGLDTAWEMTRSSGFWRALTGFDLFSTMHSGVRKRVRNRYLVDILDFFVKYVGSSAYEAPGVLNLMAHVQCRYGLWYVDGGLYNLALALARLAGKAGIRVRTGAEVVRILVSGGRATGVELKGGAVEEGDFVVCNMEVIPAYERLLGEPPSFLESLSRFEPACSGLVLHLGVRGEYPALAHHNFFFSRDPEKHFEDVFRRKVLPEDPTLYVVAVTRTDKSQAPAGCENIKVLPHIPYLQDRPFTAEDYGRLRERVLDKLERMGLEGLRGRVVVEDYWTPEDIQRRYYSNRGAIYGVVSDRRKNRGFKAPKRSSKYGNLYFVGGSVNPGGGMPMAVLSGRQVRDRIRASCPDGSGIPS
jgi:diapolycopene oxygenase